MTKSHVGQAIAYLIESARKSHDSGIATSNSPMHSPLGVQAFRPDTGRPAHSPIQARTIDQTDQYNSTWSVCKGSSINSVAT